jgi:hypothetical protein
MKKTFFNVGMISISLLFVMAVGNVNAAEVGGVCTVNYVGADAVANSVFDLTCPSLFSGDRWYQANLVDAKSYLAIALTAVSLGKSVYIVMDDITAWQPIKRLYLIP